MEYDIIYDSRLKNLCKIVRGRIKEGWTPLGAPFVAEPWFYQALTRGARPAGQRVPTDSEIDEVFSRAFAWNESRRVSGAGEST